MATDGLNSNGLTGGVHLGTFTWSGPGGAEAGPAGGPQAPGTGGNFDSGRGPPNPRARAPRAPPGPLRPVVVVRRRRVVFRRRAVPAAHVHIMILDANMSILRTPCVKDFSPYTS